MSNLHKLVQYTSQRLSICHKRFFEQLPAICNTLLLLMLHECNMPPINFRPDCNFPKDMKININAQIRSEQNEQENWPVLICDFDMRK